MRISDWSSDVCSSDLELFGEIFDDLAVEILAAEEGVAVGRLHLEHAVADFEDRNVEGTAAEVIDRDRLVLRLVEAIGERCRGRLVDDAQHFEAGDLAGVLGRLTLRVVEIGGDGDDGLFEDRKGGVEGKSVSVSVDMGGGR